MAQVTILILFSLITWLLGSHVATEYSAQVAFLVYPWAHTLTWLGPAVFLSAAAALTIDSIRTARQGRGAVSGAHRDARAVVSTVMGLAFLALSVELLTFKAMNDVTDVLPRFLSDINTVGPPVLLAAAIATLAWGAYRIAARSRSAGRRPEAGGSGQSGR